MPRSVPVPNTAEELKCFKVAPGFEVNLFASDPMIANPININFDERGRMWVATSTTYPMLAPGETPNDKIIILEDLDHDGRADKATVFADGLLVPHSVMPGDGGAYVTQSTELLHLSSSHGDDRADVRRVLLSGFGNADVHHMIHCLRWGPGGELYFYQSIYINSHVETPWGVQNLNAAGLWRFHPDSMHSTCSAAGWSTRGATRSIAGASRWGPTAPTAAASPIYFQEPCSWACRAKRDIVQPLNPGHPKACGLEILSGRHLSESWRSVLLTTDFRANRVVGYRLSEEGSGYVSQPLGDVLSSTHRSFRPVDIKMGPDGAIYIVDWYNPIIDHGEVDFHHPLRDKQHGRIWRLTAKGRPLVKPPNWPGPRSSSCSPRSASRKIGPAARPGGCSRSGTEPPSCRSFRGGSRSSIRPIPSSIICGSKHCGFTNRWIRSASICSTRCSARPTTMPGPRRCGCSRRGRRGCRTRCGGSPRPSRTSTRKSAWKPSAPCDRSIRWRRPNSRCASWTNRWTRTSISRPGFRPAKLQPQWLPALQAGRPVFRGDPQKIAFALSAIDSPAALKPLVELYRTGQIAAGQRLDVLRR